MCENVPILGTIFIAAPVVAERMAIPVESGFEGGHGSHWDAVLEDPGELARVVAEVYKRGAAAPPVAHAAGGGTAEVRFRSLPFAGGAFEVRLIEVALPGGGKPAIVTLYPHMRDAAAPLRASPSRVIEWGGGDFEAEVGAKLPAGEVTFFATDYFERRADYRRGAALRARL